MSLVSNYVKRNRRRVDELVSVALLCLTETVKRAASALVDDNIGPYLTANITQALNHYLAEDCLIRLPARSKTRNDLKNPTIGSLSNKIFNEEKDGYEEARSPKLESAITAPSGDKVAKIWERLDEVLQTPLERDLIALKAQNYTNKEVALMLGLSEPQVSKLKKEIEDRYYRGLDYE